MERLLLKLLWELLKLVVKLVLFVVTGTWHRFGSKISTVKTSTMLEQHLQTLRLRAQQAQVRASETRGSSPALSNERTWPFEFEPEAFEEEPDSEDEALEQERALARRRALARARKLRVPAVNVRVSAGNRSIAQALRDPRTVREAIVLGAALGPRRPRH